MDKEINKSDEYSSLSDVDEILPTVDLDQEELKDLDETPPPPPPPRPLPVKKRVVRHAEVCLKDLLFLVVLFHNFMGFELWVCWLNLWYLSLLDFLGGY